jgi:hypothetical protein
MSSRSVLEMIDTFSEPFFVDQLRHFMVMVTY